jgi:hypothetical protein
MKKITWDNPNKMHFESPHKTFNRQTKLISTGNVIGNTQLSNYIRPYREIECNGFTNPPGHLQNYDLTKNVVGNLLPNHIREEIRKLTHDHGGIVYHFHHWQGDKRIPDGIVLTEGHDRGNKFIKVWYLTPSTKAWGAVEEAIEYITN